MSKNTPIEWCHHTFNPWHGCTKVSPACDHCYAEALSHRYGFKIWGQDVGRRFFGDKHWHEPFKWNDAAERGQVRARVFCGSMCDVMEDRRDLDVLRGDLWQVIQSTPWLDWLLLTKRPQNFRRFLPARWRDNPQPNVWLMTTVELPEYQWRIDELKCFPAVVHGLSIEPLLGLMQTLGEYLDGIDWVICGGESGPGARPMHPDWARGVRDQCDNVGTAFFFKQWGEYGPWVDHQRPYDSPGRIYVASDGTLKKLGESNNGQDLRDFTIMERVGKKASGRLLDGREWNEFPTGTVNDATPMVVS